MAWHSGPVNFAASASMNTRVRAGMSRRPGKTAHALTGGNRQSASTGTSSPLRTYWSAK